MTKKNSGDNRYLGFNTKKQYIDFCKYMVEVYEKNEEMTITGMCRYVKREHQVHLNRERARQILHKFGAKVRPQSGSTYHKQRSRRLSVLLKKSDVDFMDELKDTYGRYMRTEVLDFCFALLRGRETPHLILWFGDCKSIFFMFDKKNLKYIAFGENLSKLEQKVLEEIMIMVEDDGSLEPAKHYARTKHLIYYGDNE